MLNMTDQVETTVRRRIAKALSKMPEWYYPATIVGWEFKDDGGVIIQTTNGAFPWTVEDLLGFMDRIEDK